MDNEYGQNNIDSDDCPKRQDSEMVTTTAKLTTLQARRTTQYKTRNGDGAEFVEYEDDIIFPAEFMSDPETKLADIKTLPLQDSVVVVTYPKSGTHWVANMVLRLRKRSETDDISRWGFFEMTPADVLRSTSTGHVFVSHLHPKRMPGVTSTSNVKFVFVLRNPKDVVVSYYHHLKKVTHGQTKQDWDEFLQDFMDGKLPWGSFPAFIHAWKTEIYHNKQLDVKVLYYEDMIDDCVTQLKSLSEFLGTDKSEADLEEIVKECSLENLRTAANKTKGKGPCDKDGNSVIYRQGGIGGWKQHFTVAQNEQFDKFIKEKLTDCKFTFKYE